MISPAGSPTSLLIPLMKNGVKGEESRSQLRGRARTSQSHPGMDCLSPDSGLLGTVDITPGAVAKATPGKPKTG